MQDLGLPSPAPACGGLAGRGWPGEARRARFPRAPRCGRPARLAGEKARDSEAVPGRAGRRTVTALTPIEHAAGLSNAGPGCAGHTEFTGLFTGFTFEFTHEKPGNLLELKAENG